MSETWTISKSFPFEASHRLPNHDGKCARLHGHSWVLTVALRSHKLIEEGAKQGMVTDYYDVGLVVKPFVEQHLDHWHLNDSTGLTNPTSENLCKWIFGRLKPRLPSLMRVSIAETCTSEASYESNSNL